MIVGGELIAIWIWLSIEPYKATLLQLSKMIDYRLAVMLTFPLAEFRVEAIGAAAEGNYWLAIRKHACAEEPAWITANHLDG